MPGKAAVISLSVRLLTILRKLSGSKSEQAMLVQRATVILKAHEGLSNGTIADQVSLNRCDVGKWRRRWQATEDQLAEVEQQEPKKLAQAVRETLRDAPRAGCGGKFTAEQVTRILALACEDPALSNRPITHWTHAELHDEILKRKIVPSISLSHVGTLLRKAMLQPHRRKMWINTTEKDPEVFARQAEKVCETYLAAQERNAEDGTRTVSVDEMTGLQALERNAPDKPVCPGQVAKSEFEYTRHGTTTLIGNWDVVQGKMLATTIGPTRTEEDFVAHIRQTVATDPDAPWIFVQDCLNVHWSASLVEWIRDVCEPARELGKKRCSRSAEESGEPTWISV